MALDERSTASRSKHGDGAAGVDDAGEDGQGLLPEGVREVLLAGEDGARLGVLTGADLAHAGIKGVGGGAERGGVHGGAALGQIPLLGAQAPLDLGVLGGQGLAVAVQGLDQGAAAARAGEDLVAVDHQDAAGGGCRGLPRGGLLRGGGAREKGGEQEGGEQEGGELQNCASMAMSKFCSRSKSSFWIAREKLNRKGPIGVLAKTERPTTERRRKPSSTSTPAAPSASLRPHTLPRSAKAPPVMPYSSGRPSGKPASNRATEKYSPPSGSSLRASRSRGPMPRLSKPRRVRGVVKKRSVRIGA